MKVKCISNSGQALPPDCLRPSWGFAREKEFPLRIGKTYQVYALTVLFGRVWDSHLRRKLLPLSCLEPVSLIPNR